MSLTELNTKKSFSMNKTKIISNESSDKNIKVERSDKYSQGKVIINASSGRSIQSINSKNSINSLNPQITKVNLGNGINLLSRNKAISNSTGKFLQNDSKKNIMIPQHTNYSNYSSYTNYKSNYLSTGDNISSKNKFINNSNSKFNSNSITSNNSIFKSNANLSGMNSSSVEKPSYKGLNSKNIINTANSISSLIPKGIHKINDVKETNKLVFKSLSKQKQIEIDDSKVYIGERDLKEREIRSKVTVQTINLSKGKNDRKVNLNIKKIGNNESISINNNSVNNPDKIRLYKINNNMNHIVGKQLITNKYNFNNSITTKNKENNTSNTHKSSFNKEEKDLKESKQIINNININNNIIFNTNSVNKINKDKYGISNVNSLGNLNIDNKMNSINNLNNIYVKNLEKIGIRNNSYDPKKNFSTNIILKQSKVNDKFDFIPKTKNILIDNINNNNNINIGNNNHTNNHMNELTDNNRVTDKKISYSIGNTLRSQKNNNVSSDNYLQHQNVNKTNLLLNKQMIPVLLRPEKNEGSKTTKNQKISEIHKKSIVNLNESFKNYEKNNQKDDAEVINPRIKDKEEEKGNVFIQNNSTTEKRKVMTYSLGKLKDSMNSLQYNNTNLNSSSSLTRNLGIQNLHSFNTRNISSNYLMTSESVKNKNYGTYSGLLPKENLIDKKVELPNLPISAKIFHKLCNFLLSIQEKQDLEALVIQDKNIYYIGEISKRIEIFNTTQKIKINDNTNLKEKEKKNEEESESGNYTVKPGEQINFRYEVIKELGSGSFGQALKCHDHKNKVDVCLKIIKSKKKFTNQAKIEIRLLQYINNNDVQDESNVIKLIEHFTFRNHVCLIFDLLDINLYELLKYQDFCGLDMSVIRKIAIQLLYTLIFLQNHKIIHCDLKPENILLKTFGKTGIKVIDFGSSCFEGEKLYSYIQSRFYRAPEIILGLNYGLEIDIWSFGCILAELYTGIPIFPGENEIDQLGYISEYFGYPNDELINKARKKSTFFETKKNEMGQTSYIPIKVANSRGKIRQPFTKKLSKFLNGADEEFIDLIRKCLEWDPEKRIKPDEAILHSWITEGMPDDILEYHRQNHLKRLKEMKKE